MYLICNIVNIKRTLRDRIEQYKALVKKKKKEQYKAIYKSIERR